MDISSPVVSPLRQCMLDDMRTRKMAEHTQDGYIRAVRKLAAFVGRSSDTATVEELVLATLVRDCCATHGTVSYPLIGSLQKEM